VTPERLGDAADQPLALLPHDDDEAEWRLGEPFSPPHRRPFDDLFQELARHLAVGEARRVPGLGDEGARPLEALLRPGG
jgi:hypothetical protein